MIVLPALFETILQQKPLLYSAVQRNFNLFEPWLEQSGMPFFPGFTDHSPRHINDVLETAASLLSDASRDLLSPEDITVLSMAILLHDCGMHLTQDGFRALIAKPVPAMLSGLNDRPWQQLWSDFLGEANRFGQEKLIAIFGDSEPLRIEQFDCDNLSERDCLLIGEFVRRHHARLAHEIAMRGVPSRSSQLLELVDLDDELRDLAGLVARSHGMSIRATFSYIENKYGLVSEYRKVKMPYLMAVLRIADYVQVQSERALKSLLSVKELRSPISRQEWRNHFAVRDVSTNHNDPEALYVHAAPTDVRTYLKLVALFKDIQRELDLSWATLGEVYGRLGGLASLGLSWRRIRSNLDKTDAFASSVPYIPIKAGFDASGPDLLKLLVGPLYDYSYDVGVRELIQNAVDACRELIDLGILPIKDEHSKDDWDVLVELNETEEGTGWITITDKGVGMSLDTVTNYFLIAGASFRNSDLWKRLHADEQGHSRVLRGGRFGVGALAAFLLGDEIKVCTRHFDRPETEGLEFTARMDEPLVELKRCIAPVGTTIKIWISDPAVFKKLRPMDAQSHHHLQTGSTPIKLKKWPQVDWFVQSKPRVKYTWAGFSVFQKTQNGERTPLQAEFKPSRDNLIPLLGEVTEDWHPLPDANPYVAIFWRYLTKINNSTNIRAKIEYIASREITVNGIRVKEMDKSTSDQRLLTCQEHSSYSTSRSCELLFSLIRPSTAIFDPTGICPINLQRSSVAFDRMGIDDRLFNDVIKLYMREIVDAALICESFADFQMLCYKMSNHYAVKHSGLISPICATSSGIRLSTYHALEPLKIKLLIFLNADQSIEAGPIKELLKEGEALFLRQGEPGATSDLAWFRGFFSNPESFGYAEKDGLPEVIRGTAVSFMPYQKWQKASAKSSVRSAIIDSVQHLSEINDYNIVFNGNKDVAFELAERLSSLLAQLGGKAEISAWTVDLRTELSEKKPFLFGAWESAVGESECTLNGS